MLISFISLFQAKHACFPIANGGNSLEVGKPKRNGSREKASIGFDITSRAIEGTTRHCSCIILSQQPLDGCGIHSRFLSLRAINAFDCTALVGPPISWAHPMCSATTRAWEGWLSACRELWDKTTLGPSLLRSWNFLETDFFF